MKRHYRKILLSKLILSDEDQVTDFCKLQMLGIKSNVEEGERDEKS